MPPEILALLDKPVLLLAVLAVGAVFGMIAERLTVTLGRQARRLRYRARWANGPRGNRQDYGPRPGPRPALRSLAKAGAPQTPPTNSASSWPPTSPSSRCSTRARRACSGRWTRRCL